MHEVVLDAIRQLPKLRYVWINPRYHAYHSWEKARGHSSAQSKGLARLITDLKRYGTLRIVAFEVSIPAVPSTAQILFDFFQVNGGR